MIGRLYYANGRVGHIEIDEAHDQLDVARRYPPDVAVERGGYPGELVFRRTGDRYNGEHVYREVTE